MSAERRIYYMSRFELTGTLFLSPRREPRRRVSAELKIERRDIGARTTTILFSVYKLTVKGESRNVTVPSDQSTSASISRATFFFSVLCSDTLRNESLLRGSRETRRSRQIDAGRLMYQVHRLFFFSLQLRITTIERFER